ncbi:MAG: alcohol dehydrogenase catalytic domain-containing protein [Planctomycetes bacterium]|nr:alcohol dehydrogenase catalytic domain-containing protein [Planctomycetota bacterium]
MTTVEFDALDYRADTTFAPAHYRLHGDERGWTVERDGTAALELGPGYRLLRTRQCGVCSTDLARHHLPFPLPQVTGHEVIARDESGRRYVVEINASHHARGVAECAFCRAGLHTHCPDRLTLGIHGLPGGFGPWLLAPVAACLEVPDVVPDAAAVLVEPFAAALHAVDSIVPRAGDRIAVLGPRRLGMLVVAALAGVRAERRRAGTDFTVVAFVRDPSLRELATAFGADEVQVLGAGAAPEASCDVVIDTTGNPEGLPTAVRIARREVHLKSTHGQVSCGLANLTALVVDELSIARFPDRPPAPGASAWEQLALGGRPRVAWLAASPPPAWLASTAEVRAGRDAAALAASFDRETTGLPRATVAVAGNATEVDAAIRPRAGDERSLVRPRGTVLVTPDADVAGSDLLRAVVVRGLVLSSSRCGDFRRALGLLAADADLRRIGERLVTHRFAAADLARAFAVAGSRACIKAVVEHEDTGGGSA